MMNKIRVVLVAAVVVLTFAAGVSYAGSGVVAVSSTTATTLSTGGGSRQAIILSNETTNPVYLGLTSSSATVAAGFVLESSATSRSGASRMVIENYGGAIYGLAGAGAVGAIRKIEIPR